MGYFFYRPQLPHLILQFTAKIKWGAYVLMPAFFLLCYSCYHTLYVMGVAIDNQLIGAFLDTNMQETAAFFSLELALLFVGFLFFGVFWAYYLRRFVVAKLHVIQLGLLLLGFGLSALLAMKCAFYVHPALPSSVPKIKMQQAHFYSEISEARAWPLSRLHSFAGHLLNDIQYGGGKYYRYVTALPSSAEPSSELLHEEDLTIVFHVGESNRADRWGLSGFERQTCPELSKLGGNIINYPDVLAYGPSTRYSMVGIFTDANLVERRAKHTSFVDLFVNHGYESFGSFNASYNQNESIYKVVLGECKHIELVALDDMTDWRFKTQYAVVQDYLQKNNSKRKLLVLNNYGNHVPVECGKQFEHFLPSGYSRSNPRSDMQALLNTYDNSTLETDMFCAKIIHELKDKKAIYFFVSDHGVELYEEGRYGHGVNNDFVRKVPMFIWMSDSYMEAHPDTVAMLRGHQNKRLAHDHVFHTILALGNIKSVLLNDELNLSTKELWEVPQGFGLNFDDYDSFLAGRENSLFSIIRFILGL